LVPAGDLTRRPRLVYLAPPYRVFGARLLDDVLVARRAAGKEPGRNRKAAAQGKFTFAALNRTLVQRRRGLVPMHAAEVVQPLPFEPEAALHFGHRIILFTERFLPSRSGAGASQGAPADARA